jgi:hypothetical protein
MNKKTTVIVGDKIHQDAQIEAARYLWQKEQDRRDEIKAHVNAWYGGLFAVALVFGLSGLIQ